MINPISTNSKTSMNTYAVRKFESEVKKIEESKALLQTM